jgi:hypothetical protein
MTVGRGSQRKERKKRKLMQQYKQLTKREKSLIEKSAFVPHTGTGGLYLSPSAYISQELKKVRIKKIKIRKKFHLLEK